MKRREFLKSAVAAGATMALPSNAPAQTPATQGTGADRPVDGHYLLGPDSKRQPGVPAGSVSHFIMDRSKFFPGTRRTIDLYIPAQYTADKPACVWVALDGLSETTPIVFDNLIHKKELPVTIAIGLHSGEISSAHPPQNPRFNRSFEFDSLSSVLGDFILEELLPAVEKQKAPSGQSILLSANPNDRGITGASTGGIGSFTVAWRNPDAFRRVFTMIGTFVGMRGGDRYPVLVRKTETKPIRIFMQDGSKDGWPGGLELGDWWMSNQAMERALTFAGYQVNHAWGVLGHEGSQGESILPDVLRWLWRDWPTPLHAGQSSNFAIRAIAKPGETWEAVGWDHATNQAPPQSAIQFAGYASPPVITNRSMHSALASDRQGNVYVQNPSTGKIYRIGATGKAESFATVSPGDNGIAFGPDGMLYIVETAKARILKCNPAGKLYEVAKDIPGHRLTVTHNGWIYVTGRGDQAYSGKVWLIRPGEKASMVAEGLNGPTGISLTPDGLWLFVAEGKGHHAYSYQVRPDGTLQYGEPFYWFHVPDTANNSGVTQVCMDRQGWAYTATRMGVQVFDRNGRVTAIFPIAEKPLSGICFGGSDFQTLYVTTGDAVYRRSVRTIGMPSWESPIILPKWSAG